MEIIFKKPEDEVPPFNEPVLVVLGGNMNGENYTHVISVMMLKRTPNCDGFDDWRVWKDNPEPSEFSNYQFYLRPIDQMDDDEEDGLEWYSDAILAWAPMPDFLELYPT